MPAIVEQFARADVTPQLDSWAIATDYDGRTDRNLIAVRAKNAKGIACWEEGQQTTPETHAVGDTTLAETPRPADGPLAECLHPIVQRRYTHVAKLPSSQSRVVDTV